MSLVFVLVDLAGGETISTSLSVLSLVLSVSVVCSVLDRLSFCGVDPGVGWVTFVGDALSCSGVWLCWLCCVFPLTWRVNVWLILLSLTMRGFPNGGDCSDGDIWLSSISCLMMMEVSKFCVFVGSLRCDGVLFIFLLLLLGIAAGM